MKKRLAVTVAAVVLAACSAAPDEAPKQASARGALNPAVAQSCPSLASFNAANLRMLTRDPLALMANGPTGSTSVCTGLTGSTPCVRHRIYEPVAGPTRTPLFLFLPGSGMEPDKHDAILALAAHAGYRAIGLAYDNRETVGSICDGTPCADECHFKVYRERELGRSFGGPRFVHPGDSIIERLYNLLVDLGLTSYYVPTAPGGNVGVNNIVWSKFIVGGFSQGASHAAIISKYVQVHGGIYLDGATNDTCLDTSGQPAPATYITNGVDVSAGRPRFGVMHRRNIPFVQTGPVPVGWNALGLGTGGWEDLDSPLLNLPLDAACTNQASLPGPDCSQHASMARDGCMPTDTTSAIAATTADGAHLSDAYLRRFCYACDAATCP